MTYSLLKQYAFIYLDKVWKLVFFPGNSLTYIYNSTIKQNKTKQKIKNKCNACSCIISFIIGFIWFFLCDKSQFFLFHLELNMLIKRDMLALICTHSHHCTEPIHVLQTVRSVGSFLTYLCDILGLLQCVTRVPSFPVYISLYECVFLRWLCAPTYHVIAS